MANDEELEEIRATAEGVLERARNDEVFCASLREDPVATLQAAGLSDDAAQQIGTEEWRPGGGDDVQGQMRCWSTCGRTFISCLVTWCADIPATNG